MVAWLLPYARKGSRHMKTADSDYKMSAQKNCWPRIFSSRLKISASSLRQLESAEPAASRLTHPLSWGGRERVAVKVGSGEGARKRGE